MIVKHYQNYRFQFVKEDMIMLQHHMWYCYHSAVETELLQCRDEGKDVSSLEAQAKAIDIVAPLTEQDYNRVMEMVDALEALPEPENAEFIEPSDLDGIHAQQLSRTEPKPYDKAALQDRIHGAWIGRVTGCLLGKPVENRSREYIRKIAEADGNYPIVRYLRGNVPNPTGDPFFDDPNFKNNCFIEKVNGFSPSDDDTNYTTLALSIVEQYGRDFTSLDVVEGWLRNFPAYCLCTAEQAAFRNFLNHILPPRSGYVRNPYREWIGAQIRGDFFGYVCPGDPYTAADYAWRDACCTHTKNGIYGEMLVAAMIAESAVTDDRRRIVDAGLACIPQKSRLKRDIDKVLAMYDERIEFMEAVDRIHTQYPQNHLHNAVHTIPNAMIVVAALLWGEGDYEKTLGYSVMAAMDTDCNGATVGSIIGMITGAAAIPTHFTDPICDTLRTDIAGNSLVKISDMAARTLRLIP
jgi:ADP-ribosylglycohydrolase